MITHIDVITGEVIELDMTMEDYYYYLNPDEIRPVIEEVPDANTV